MDSSLHKAAPIHHVIDRVRQSEHNKVKLAVPDIDGVLRGKFVHKNKFLSAVESGFGFCDVVFGWDCADECYDNASFTGWHSGYPDAQARIDLSSFRLVPWDDGVPFFLADFVADDGTGLSVCPRQLLKRVVERGAQAGYRFSVGVEFEFFNFAQTSEEIHDKGFRELESLDRGMFGYSLLRASQRREYFAAMMDELLEFGVPLEGLHTETGPGVLEAAIMYSDPVEAADRAVLFKSAVKEIGARFGITPTFMAKVSPQLPGSSGHLHQSVWDGDGKTNLFADANDAQGISALFRNYLAGQVACMPQIMPCFAPTINSYKRLVDGMWAPTTVTWGLDNRTTALRVLAGSPRSTRVETRVPGADINPYIAVAAAFASGLYGIENRLPLEQDPVKGNGYEVKDAPKLPVDLMAATDSMKRSEIAKELFGDDFVMHLGQSREWEVRQFRKAVTSWELERYLEIV